MASSKQVQVNTFNSGMNKDLNPLLTPNDVMSDCLNGTIVTYNGNEFALQNDLGNYKFKHGSLPEGFVPIGMKEFSNILYIVSYNPITDEVQVGSFPSMDIIQDCNTNATANIGIELFKGINKYSEKSKESNLVFLGEPNDKYVLNPEDKYEIVVETKEDGDNGNVLWQKTNYYIYTKNNKLYNINKYISVNTDGYKSVSWDIPGNLVLQNELYVMDKFDIFPSGQRSEQSPDSNIYVSARTTWDNSKYNEVFNEIKDSLVYYYTLSEEKTDLQSWISLKDTWREAKQVSQKKHTLYNSMQSNPIACWGSPYIAICPALKKGDYTLLYDQFFTNIDVKAKLWENSNKAILINSLYYTIDEINKRALFEMDLFYDWNKSVYYKLKKHNGFEWVDATKFIEITSNSSDILSFEVRFNNEVLDEQIYKLEILVLDKDKNVDEVEKGQVESTVYLTKLVNHFDKGTNLHEFDVKELAKKFWETAIINFNENACTPYYNIYAKINNKEYNYVHYSDNDLEQFITTNLSYVLSMIDPYIKQGERNDNEIKIKNGRRYKIRKSDFLILYKNINNEIGEMWSPLIFDTMNISGKITDRYGYKFDIEQDDAYIYILHYATSPIKIDIEDGYKINIVSKESTLSLDNGFVTKEGNYFKLNEVVYEYFRSTVPGDLYKIKMSDFIDISFGINTDHTANGITDPNKDWDLWIKIEAKNEKDVWDGNVISQEIKWKYSADSDFKWLIFEDDSNRVNESDDNINKVKRYSFLGKIFHYHSSWKDSNGCPIIDISDPFWTYPDKRSVFFSIINNEMYNKRYTAFVKYSREGEVGFYGTNLRFTRESQHNDMHQRSMPFISVGNHYAPTEFAHSQAIVRPLNELSSSGWFDESYKNNKNEDIRGLIYTLDSFLTYLYLIASTSIPIEIENNIDVNLIKLNTINERQYKEDYNKFLHNYNQIKNIYFSINGISYNSNNDINSRLLSYISSFDGLKNEQWEITSDYEFIDQQISISNDFNKKNKDNLDKLINNNIEIGSIKITKGESKRDIYTTIDNICKNLSYKDNSIIGTIGDVDKWIYSRISSGGWNPVLRVKEYEDNI